jgi:hypothetical protein
MSNYTEVVKMRKEKIVNTLNLAKEENGKIYAIVKLDGKNEKRVRVGKVESMWKTLAGRDMVTLKLDDGRFRGVHLENIEYVSIEAS